MTDDDRLTAALLLLAAALLAWWLWRRDEPEPVEVDPLPPIEASASYPIEGRDYIDVQGLGRVMLATDEEREYWREKYAPPEGWNDGDDT